MSEYKGECQKKYKKEASIIIPVFNEGENLYRTVEAIYELGETETKGVEVIIADDGSTDGFPEKTAKKFTDVIINRHEKNYGTACGKCLGADAASGEVLIFADGHTSMTKGTLTNLVRYAKEYGVISPILYGIDEETWKPKDKNAIQGVWWNLDKDFKKSWFSLSEMKKVKNGIYETYGVHGGFCAIRRDIYDEVGGWDRNNLVFGIDYGMALRLWCFGHTIYHCTEAKAGHLHKKQFSVYKPRWWQIYHNRFRILHSLGTPEEIERFSHWQVKPAIKTAKDEIGRTIQTIPLYQKRICRTLTQYMERVNEIKGTKDKDKDKDRDKDKDKDKDKNEDKNEDKDNTPKTQDDKPQNSKKPNKPKTDLDKLKAFKQEKR